MDKTRTAAARKVTLQRKEIRNSKLAMSKIVNSYRWIPEEDGFDLGKQQRRKSTNRRAYFVTEEEEA